MSKNDTSSNSYKKVGDFLLQNIVRETTRYWGNPDSQWTNYIADAWMNDQSNSRWRYELIKDFFDLNKGARILDMASGCGTFVFYGLLNGYAVYGIEPEEWKNKFNEMKIELYDYPKSWRSRFIEAFGEALPFQDESFDVCSSYQTLEHVSDVKACLKEILRVVRRGGMILLQFPDYRSSFEGHYRLPWLPLFPKLFAGVYLKMLGKPRLGLDSINYVTKKSIMHLLRQNGRVEVTDLDIVQFQRRTEDIINKFYFLKIGSIGKILGVMVNLIYTYFYMPLRRAFRAEKGVTLIVRKL